MAYRVTQPHTAGLESVLVRLWAANLNMRTAPRHKFSWFYRDNPLGPATACLLEFCTENTSEVVGSCGIGPRTVYVEGKPVLAGLFADFTVNKSHRTVMPALLLQRALSVHARKEFDFSYAYPNDAAVGVFSRVGYQTLGRAARYVRVLRMGRFLSRVIRVPMVTAVAATFADVALRLRDALLSARCDSRLRLEWDPDVDARFDRLFEAVRSRHRVIGDRRSNFLRWRFRERPGAPGRIAALIDDRGELRAYAVVAEYEAGTVMLADFLALTQGDLGTLLHRLAPALRSQGFDAIVTTFLGPPEIASLLSARGFRFRNLGKFVVTAAGESGGIDAAALKDPSGWYLTEADRDN